MRRGPTRRKKSSDALPVPGRSFLRDSYFEAVKPESATAFSRSVRLAFESSYLTTTWFFSRSAEADSTPGTAFSFASVLAGHFSHFQPLTLMVSVFTPARVAVLRPSAIANANDAVFMFPPEELPARSYVAVAPSCQMGAPSPAFPAAAFPTHGPRWGQGCPVERRSEERRVGKEWRAGEGRGAGREKEV